MTGPAATATAPATPTVESDLNAVRSQARPAPSAPAVSLTGSAGTRVQVLAETFSVRHDPLNEANGNCKVTALPGGRFRVRAKGQHCGVVNRNGRNYPAESTWGKHTRPDSPFMGKVRARRVIGQLEHPESGRSSMGLAAIVITEVSPPNEQGEVFIEFETMSTPGGQIVASFIRDGVGFGISSRGNGSVLRIEGVDVVQEDFDPVTFDLVVDESTPGAEVVATKVKESISRAVALLVEGAKGDAKKAAEIAEAQTRLALARDLLSEQQPPRGDSEWLLAIDDGSAHYRAYENGVGQWDVWFEPAGLTPQKIAVAMPTLKNAKIAAEEHLRLVVGNNAGKPAVAAARTKAPDPVAAPSATGGSPKAVVNVNVESKRKDEAFYGAVDPHALPEDELLVILASLAWKPSYQGLGKATRFVYTNRETGITPQEWKVAKASLMQKGLLNSQGAVDPNVAKQIKAKLGGGSMESQIRIIGKKRGVDPMRREFFDRDAAKAFFAAHAESVNEAEKKWFTTNAELKKAITQATGIPVRVTKMAGHGEKPYAEIYSGQKTDGFSSWTSEDMAKIHAFVLANYRVRTITHFGSLKMVVTYSRPDDMNEAAPAVPPLMEFNQGLVMHTVHGLIQKWQHALGNEFKVILGGSLVSGLFIHQGAKAIDVDVRFLTDEPSSSKAQRVASVTGLALRKTITVGDFPTGSSTGFMVEGFIDVPGLDLPLEIEGCVRNFKYVGWASYYTKVLTPAELEKIRAGKTELRGDKAAYKAFKAKWRDEVEKRAVSRGLVKVGESRAAQRMKLIRESFVVTDGAPFTGTLLTLEFGTPKEAEDAGDILADAGMYCFCDGVELLVYSDVAMPEQAVAAIRRVLASEDITMAAEGRIASIRKGRLIKEARYAMKVRESESGRDAPAGAGEYDGEEPKGSGEVRAPGISVSSPKKPEPWEADDADKAKDKKDEADDDKAKDDKKEAADDKDDKKTEADSDKEKDEASDDDKKKDEADSDDDKKKEGVSVPTSGSKGDSKTWMPSGAGSVRMESYGEDDIEIIPDDDDVMGMGLDMETSRADMPAEADDKADKKDEAGDEFDQFEADDKKDDKKDERKGSKKEADDDKKKDEKKGSKREADDDKKKDERKGKKRESDDDKKKDEAARRKAYEEAARKLRAGFGLPEADDKKDDKDEAEDDDKKKDEDNGFGGAPEIDDPEDLDHDLLTTEEPDEMPLMGGDGPEEMDPAFAQPGMTGESRRPVINLGKRRTGRTESRAPKVETRNGRRVVKVPRRVFERLRFLEGEVARLENDNGHLTSLVDEMERAQRKGAVAATVETVLAKHPMLEPMKARLVKCESVEAVKEEAAGLLTMLRESQKKTIVTPLSESGDPKPVTAPKPAPTAPVVRGTTVTSAKTEGAPQGLPESDAAPGALTKPLAESAARADDTASRVADYRRRHRRTRGSGQA